MRQARKVMDDLKQRFSAHGYQLPALMHEIATSDNFFAVTPVETKSAEAPASPAKEAR